ncbi:hypothetical protein B7P43_G06053 [Cryptotermes secundus]|uniref:Uncharacterized protein n=1 Tax=Cryptotermes secundus TaxID=105785 RepID=A0A2J7QQN2_9NEOP|nr:hypothetical protein B7P43_G06053 [Cryptotermes secundus]
MMVNVFPSTIIYNVNQILLVTESWMYSFDLELKQESAELWLLVSLWQKYS